MGHRIPKAIYTLLVSSLWIVLVLVVWQPVLPSGWIIQGMATQIDPKSLSLERPAVLRFELAGRGGGTYNLMLSREEIEVTKGKTRQADLIIATKAADFNRLVFQLVQGKADEFTIGKLVISNVLKIAGDMSILERLNPTEKGKS